MYMYTGDNKQAEQKPEVVARSRLNLDTILG